MSVMRTEARTRAKTVRLSEAAEINPKVNRALLDDDYDVSFVPMAAVGAATGQMGATTIRKFKEVKKGYTYFRDGDVLFAKVTPCMENGKMVIAKHLRNGIGFGSTEFHVLRPTADVDVSYLYHFVSSETYRKEAAQHMTGAVGLRRVPTAFLENSEIPLPPIAEQKKLVAEIEKQFSRLDEAVANLKRVKANLKRYKAAVLKAAVEGRLVPTEAELARKDGRNYETGEQLLQRILEIRRNEWDGRGKHQENALVDKTSLPVLPEGWTWTSVGEVAAETRIGLDRGREKQNLAGIGVPYVKMGNVTMDGKVLLDELAFVETTAEEQLRYSLVEGDLLFNTRNSSELVGKIGMVRKPPTCAVYNNNLMRIRVSGGVLPTFICAQMCAFDFRRRLERVKKATTNVAAVYAKDLLPLPLALPPEAEQRRIVAGIESRMSLVDGVEKQTDLNLKRAERLRQSVLAKLFSVGPSEN